MVQNFLAGRTVVVFGGTGALGSAVVVRMLADEAKVIVADASTPASTNANPNVRYTTVDALDEESVESCFASLDAAPWAVVNLIGGFAGGYAGHGYYHGGYGHGYGGHGWGHGRQLELNLMTAATITKHAVRRFKADGLGGRIVHTSSRVATQDGHNGFSYSVSKLAVVRLVEAAAVEVRDDSITVNCVMPSIIDTPANRASMPTADYAKWPRASQIAEVISFLVSDASELISGAAIPVYGRG